MKEMESPRLSHLRALVLFVCLSLLPVTNALHFYLEGTYAKCFIEDLPSETTVVGTYKGEDFSETTGQFEENWTTGIQIQVSQLEDNHRLLYQKGDSHGRFVFMTHNAGEHQLCFNSNSSSWFHPVKTRLYLDLLFGDASHEQTDHGKEVLSDLSVRLREINVKIQGIRKEQEYQRSREYAFRDLSEGVNSHVRNWTLLQLIVLIVTCFWQVRHLKRFFVAKKLL